MSTRQPGFDDNGNCIFCGAQGKQPAKYDGTETFSIWCSNPECIVSHPSFREQVGHKVTHRKFAVLALLPVICLVVAMVWWTNNNFAKQEPPATLRQQQVVESRPSVPERPTPAPPKQQQAVVMPSQPSQPQPVSGKNPASNQPTPQTRRATNTPTVPPSPTAARQTPQGGVQIPGRRGGTVDINQDGAGITGPRGNQISIDPNGNIRLRPRQR